MNIVRLYFFKSIYMAGKDFVRLDREGTSTAIFVTFYVCYVLRPSKGWPILSSLSFLTHPVCPSLLDSTTLSTSQEVQERIL